MTALPPGGKKGNKPASTAADGRPGSIMKPALGNFQALIFAAATGEPIHQTMFLGDAARPEPGQFASQRFGFADSGKRAPKDVLDKLVYPLRGHRLERLKITIIGEGL